MTCSSERAAKIVQLLSERDGVHTVVRMIDGRSFHVLNIAWGRDEGEDYEHVTTNISPPVEGQDIDFFLTGDVEKVIAPESEYPLWSREADAE